MSSIQDVRDELATFSPSGYEAYSTLPSNANMPAFVVDLPENVSFDASFRFATITMNAILVRGTSFGPGTEAGLLADAVATAQALNGVSGTHIRSCLVTGVSDFFTVTIGAKEALSATINLTIIAQLS